MRDGCKVSLNSPIEILPNFNKSLSLYNPDSKKVWAQCKTLSIECDNFIESCVSVSKPQNNNRLTVNVMKVRCSKHGVQHSRGRRDR